jgi:nucleoside 2-deoxyribosyltransferase
LKIYVASSWRNEDQPEVVEALREAGHEVYDFRHPHMGPGARGQGFHWSQIDPKWQEWTPEEFREALEHSEAINGCASDLAGLTWADACVLVMPCGRSAHLELGYAMGLGKLSFILLSDGEPELMYRLALHLCVDVPELLVKIGYHEKATGAVAPSETE